MERITVWAGHKWKHTPEIRTVSMKSSILSGAGQAGCSRGWFSRACNFGINGPQGNFFFLGWKCVCSFKKWHWQFLFTLVAITQDVSIILFKWGFFLSWIAASALWQGVTGVNCVLSITIAFLSVARGFCHSYFLFISLLPLPEEKCSRCNFIKTTPAPSFIWPLWPFLLLLYRKDNFILLGEKIIPNFGWWLWFIWTFLFAEELVSLLLVHVWVTQLVVAMAFWGESCFFPVDNSGCVMCI